MLLRRWRYPRRWSWVCVLFSGVALVSAVGALWDGDGDAALPGKLTWVGGAYNGLPDGTRAVVGVTLLICVAWAVLDPENGALAATVAMCAQRLYQSAISPAPSLLVIATWGAVAYLAIKDTLRIKRLHGQGRAP
jgi:hypothetical protein